MVNEQDPGRAGMLLLVPGHPLYADAVALTGAVGVQYHLDEEEPGPWILGRSRRVLGKAGGTAPPKVLCIINPACPTGESETRAPLGLARSVPGASARPFSACPSRTSACVTQAAWGRWLQMPGTVLAEAASPGGSGHLSAGLDTWIHFPALSLTCRVMCDQAPSPPRASVSPPALPRDVP